MDFKPCLWAFQKELAHPRWDGFLGSSSRVLFLVYLCWQYLNTWKHRLNHAIFLSKWCWFCQNLPLLYGFLCAWEKSELIGGNCADAQLPTKSFSYILFLTNLSTSLCSLRASGRFLSHASFVPNTPKRPHWLWHDNVWRWQNENCCLLEEGRNSSLAK